MQTLLLRIIQVIFLTYVSLIIFLPNFTSDPEISPDLMRNLLNTTDAGFLLPGTELEPVKKLLLSSGAVSFITDKPFGADIEMEKYYHDLQNYFCPLILNPAPGESVGIALFTSPERASERMAEINYSWVINWGNTRGIIKKNG